MSRKIIAIEFDGTLCDDCYPFIGNPNKTAIADARREQLAGAKLILWTCRVGADLAAAVDWCESYGLTFDAVNENLPEHIAIYSGDTRKIYADEYWDDKAVHICVGDDLEKEQVVKAGVILQSYGERKR